MLDERHRFSIDSYFVYNEIRVIGGATTNFSLHDQTSCKQIAAFAVECPSAANNRYARRYGVSGDAW